LKLSNKYDKIELPEGFKGDLSVNLYSGDLIGGDLSGQFDLELKYGKVKVGTVGTANWVVYDSEVKTGPIESAKVSSKYSEYRIGPVSGDLILETYDEEWRIGNIGGKLALNDKYSEFKFGNIGSAEVQVFDGQLEMQNVGELSIDDTKYTGYKITAVDKLKLGNVFDDSYDIGSLGAAEIRDSKYTEYKIDNLDKAFSIGQSFDDAIKMDKVAAGFSLIQFDGKYTELVMEFAQGAVFEFSVNQQYGSVDFPETRAKTQKHVEKNSRLEVVANVGGEQTGGQVNMVKVTGFDNTVKWQ
jgi:hypothetical protein